MANKSAQLLAIKNETENRLSFEVRDADGKLLRFARVGSTCDDELVAKGNDKALGSKQVFDAELVGQLQQHNTIFQGMLKDGQIKVLAA